MQFLLLFPTCLSPPRAVCTWRGSLHQHSSPVSDVSFLGAAACSRRPWGRCLSWQSLGKPVCASSCTGREKKERHWEMSLLKSLQETWVLKVGLLQVAQLIAKSREGCAGAFSSTPNALFHIKILCQNINLFQEMLHIHTFLSQHLTLQTQNAKIWIAITPEKMALMVSVG